MKWKGLTIESIQHCSDFSNFIKIIILLILRGTVVFILTDTTDSDEMQHYATFHLGIHCLPKCPFRDVQYTTG